MKVLALYMFTVLVLAVIEVVGSAGDICNVGGFGSVGGHSPCATFHLPHDTYYQHQ